MAATELHLVSVSGVNALGFIGLVALTALCFVVLTHQCLDAQRLQIIERLPGAMPHHILSTRPHLIGK